MLATLPAVPFLRMARRVQVAASGASFEHELAALRPALLKFARVQLRNDASAEDVVSETLIAILEKPAAFAGLSSLRTYATGVLKHKIIDQLRRGGREVQVIAGDGESTDDVFDALFAADGHWATMPPSWGDPDATLERTEFFEVLQACIDHLPATLARLFMMREWLELETDDICRELDISANHCFVMLFRARARLRECLQIRWFDAVAP